MVINSSPIPILVLTVVFYLVQPPFVNNFVINLVLTIFFCGCILLPYLLYQKVAPSPHFVMLWMPLAMISLRYFHALCGRRKTIRSFQSPQSRRLHAVCPGYSFQRHSCGWSLCADSTLRAQKELKICLAQLFAIVALLYLVLQLGLDKILPCFYVISLATAVPRMVFEIPIRFLLDDRVEIVPLTVMPYLVRPRRDPQAQATIYVWAPMNP
jgi:hypothetical protein